MTVASARALRRTNQLTTVVTKTMNSPKDVPSPNSSIAA